MKIVITGGGTGGHVYPAIAVAQALSNDTVIYAGSSHGLEKKEADRLGITFQPIRAGQLVGKNLFKKFSNLVLLVTGFFQSLFFLIKFKPEVVVGTGGYGSAPILLASVILRIPSLILEQNLLPGRTTRFFSRFVSGILVSFEESKKYLPEKKVILTGNPVRPEIGTWNKEQACKKLDLAPALPVILVTGASQGARAINDCIVQALPLMTGEKWQILHLTGERHYDAVLNELKGKSMPPDVVYRAYPYTNQMEILYGASDMVIARAGATSMAEITLTGKPAILIPYPYAADNHQEMNARWLEKQGGCVTLLEKDLTPATLYKTMKTLTDNHQKFLQMGEEARRTAHPEALEKILVAIRNSALHRD